VKITLFLIGKTNKEYISEAIEEYAQRIERYCKFEIKILPELKNTKAMPIQVQMQKESEMLLPAINGYQEIILLDDKGKQFTSEEFANFISKRMVNGQRDMAFVVGGPWGFDANVYKVANSKLSLSKMTLSHQIIRPVFLEQLYRAFTIINGEPYHHS